MTYIIVQGDNDIDYVSAYGPFDTVAEADAALDALEVAVPGYQAENDSNGEQILRIVRLQPFKELVVAATYSGI